MADATIDIGDAAYVKDSQRDAKRAAAAKKETVIVFMSTEDGRKWFYELLEKCRVGTNPFSKDLSQMSFNCGELNIGQQIQIELENASPELYLQMIKEQNNG